LDGRAPDNGQSAGDVHGFRLFYQANIGTSETDSGIPRRKDGRSAGAATRGGGWRTGRFLTGWWGVRRWRRILLGGGEIGR
jgi:hypothetical protein